MRLCSYLLPGGAQSYGIANDIGIHDVGEDLRSTFPNLRSILEAGAIERFARSALASNPIPFERVRLLPPIPQPDKIICIGLNYSSHITETGREAPKYPSIFTRYPSSLVGHRETLVRPAGSHSFDFEGELAVVIGKRGRHIAKGDALDFLVGYSCFNDGSIRDFQRHTTQFWPGKNFDRSGSMGPWIVTVDEIPDPTSLSLETKLNGQTLQSAPISDLAFGIPALVAYISSITELLPGDVIATGTPSGVGLFRDPQLWMKPGDLIEVTISNIGTLKNSVGDEAG